MTGSINTTMKSDSDSGFRWGPFNLEGARPWRLRIQQRGGSVVYPYPDREPKVSQHISDCDTTKPIIHKGNHFSQFTHPRDYPPNCEFYFWDNCLLPQLMYRTEANPTGTKQWTRIVYRSTVSIDNQATESELDLHERRVNDRLRHMSGGRTQSWRDVIKILRPCEPRGRTILLALSSDNAIQHYYGVTNQELEQRVRSVCQRRGWLLDIRRKPARAAREQGGSITDQLLSKDYYGVVCTHSALAIEAICAGTPVVGLGATAIRGSTSRWWEFEADYFLAQVAPLHVEQRIQQLLCHTWHKDELMAGTWSQSPDLTRHTPYTDWEIFDE